MLRYCFVLIGLRGNNLPAQEETHVLIDFLIDMLGDYTISEFKLAFKLAVAGKLDCDIKHYENFTPEYISRIMQAYRKYANSILEEQERFTKIKQLEQPKNTGPLKLVNIYYKEFLNGELNWKTVSDVAFDTCFKLTDMKFTQQEINKYVLLAKQEIEEDYKTRRKKIELIELEKCTISNVCWCNMDVNRLAKIKLLQSFFEQQKRNKIQAIISK